MKITTTSYLTVTTLDIVLPKEELKAFFYLSEDERPACHQRVVSSQTSTKRGTQAEVRQPSANFLERHDSLWRKELINHNSNNES